MKTCQACPDIYPWTGKTGIRSSRIDNEVDAHEWVTREASKLRCDRGESRRTSTGPGQSEYLKDAIEMLKRSLNLSDVGVSWTSERSSQSLRRPRNIRFFWTCFWRLLNVYLNIDVFWTFALFGKHCGSEGKHSSVRVGNFKYYTRVSRRTHSGRVRRCKFYK